LLTHERFFFFYVNSFVNNLILLIINLTRVFYFYSILGTKNTGPPFQDLGNNRVVKEGSLLCKVTQIDGKVRVLITDNVIFCSRGVQVYDEYLIDYRASKTSFWKLKSIFCYLIRLLFLYFDVGWSITTKIARFQRKLNGAVLFI